MSCTISSTGELGDLGDDTSPLDAKSFPRHPAASVASKSRVRDSSSFNTSSTVTALPLSHAHSATPSHNLFTSLSVASSILFPQSRSVLYANTVACGVAHSAIDSVTVMRLVIPPRTLPIALTARDRSPPLPPFPSPVRTRIERTARAAPSTSTASSSSPMTRPPARGRRPRSVERSRRSNASRRVASRRDLSDLSDLPDRSDRRALPSSSIASIALFIPFIRLCRPRVRPTARSTDRGPIDRSEPPARGGAGARAASCVP